MPDFDTRRSTFWTRFSHNLQVKASRVSRDTQYKKILIRRLLLVVVFGCLSTWYFWSSREKPSSEDHFQAPQGTPSYEQIYAFENALPQHSLSLPSPEGAKGKYVKFSNQYRGTGWNNANIDIQLSAHLAHASGRSYVFQDFHWSFWHYPLPLPYTQGKGPAPRTPLNAIHAGPISGGAWPEGDSTPRSISERWFDVVCPVKERLVVESWGIKQAVTKADGTVVFKHWQKLLTENPARCIEITIKPGDGTPQVFDLWLVGNSRSHSLWDGEVAFGTSATARSLHASPLINSALIRNQYLFQTGERPSADKLVSADPFSRMLALHLRRGDYDNACQGFAKWNSTFYSWNGLPSILDPFTPPPGGVPGENTPENTALYMSRCFPDVHEVVKKANAVRKDFMHEKVTERILDIIYVATNEKGDWLDRLKKALAESGWVKVITTKDLQLDLEQITVGMSIDMEIGRRAASFIGNGWSSFSSNIMSTRMVDGKTPATNRLF